MDRLDCHIPTLLAIWGPAITLTVFSGSEAGSYLIAAFYEVLSTQPWCYMAFACSIPVYSQWELGKELQISFEKSSSKGFEFPHNPHLCMGMGFSLNGKEPWVWLCPLVITSIENHLRNWLACPRAKTTDLELWAYGFKCKGLSQSCLVLLCLWDCKQSLWLFL